MDDRPVADDLDVSAVIDTVHDVLSESRRRSILARLTERGRPMEVKTLVTEVVAADPRTADDSGVARLQETTTVSLIHVHLPKLVETGFVEWDRSEAIVELTPFVEQLSENTPAVGALLEASISPPDRVEE